MITLVRFVGVIGFGYCLSHSAVGQIVDLQFLEEKMKFPQGHLALNDITDIIRKRLGKGVLAAQEVRGRDKNVFHPMSFIVAESGTLLTDKFIEDSDAYIEAMLGMPEESIGLRRVILADGSWGYIGLEAFGPGGALIAATLTDPARIWDVKIIISYENQPLFPVEGGELYAELFSGESDATSSITALAESLIKKAKTIEKSVNSSVDRDLPLPTISHIEIPSVTNSEVGLSEDSQRLKRRDFALWTVLLSGALIVMLVILIRRLRS